MKKTYSQIFFAACLGFLILLSACDIQDKKTTMEVIDPHRHYHPILQRQDLNLAYQIKNTGEHPLFIRDIQASCGCILIDESSIKVLPKGGKGFIRIKYEGHKNLGYAKHYITIYANLEQFDTYELTFDVNIVPDALYTEDYEKVYKESLGKKGNELTDGHENERHYYTDEMP